MIIGTSILKSIKNNCIFSQVLLCGILRFKLEKLNLIIIRRIKANTNHNITLYTPAINHENKSAGKFIIGLQKLKTTSKRSNRKINPNSNKQYNASGIILMVKLILFDKLNRQPI